MLFSREVSLDLTLVVLDLLLVLFAKDSQHSLQLNKLLKVRIHPLRAVSFLNDRWCYINVLLRYYINVLLHYIVTILYYYYYHVAI